MKVVKYLLQTGLFLLGLVLFGWVVYSVRIENLTEAMRQLPLWTAAILLFYPFVSCWDVWGWKLVFSDEWRHRVTFWRLFGIRLAGESVNNITPFIDVGGEFLKVFLVARRFGIPKKPVLATVIIVRTALFFSEILFWLVAIIALFTFLPAPESWRWICLGVTGICLAITAGLVFFQKRGFFNTCFKILNILTFKRGVFEKLPARFEDVDREISVFYERYPKRWMGSLTLHLTGWLVGGIEMFLILRACGIEANLLEALALEAFLHMIRTASFFIPGNWGVQEAGLALMVQALGAHPSLGVLVSFLKRIRQVVWTSLGFFVWSVFEGFSKPPSQEIDREAAERTSYA